MLIEHYKEVSNRKWMLVFYHKFVKNEDLFKNKTEALFSNTENKYSILSKINPSFRINGRYEFLLEYPRFQGYFNHWSQRINPINAQPNEDNGYKPINISWTNQSWHGLALSSTSNTLIDGSPYNETWFYSIGSITNWGNTIPSYVDLYLFPESERSKYITTEVMLWIRVYSEQSKCLHQKSYLNMVYFIIYLVVS